jgi:hypothetical protein
MKAPYPFFGGKSRIADMVWDRFGDVANFVEPFFGSGAVLLARPHEPKVETVNDIDAFISNFWRAVKADPDAVADHADWPVNEVDLEARHKWLVAQPGKTEFANRMKDDPDYCDTKRAGWWVWGMSSWIGTGWCQGEWFGRGADGNHGCGTCDDAAKLPHLGTAGNGVNRKRPHLSNAGRGVNRGPAGTCAERSESLIIYMRQFADRLRNVRVCCGDWSRVVGPCVTIQHGMTGVFLDPPYSAEDRSDCYNHESYTVANDVLEWCVANGGNPLLRIALCGYEGEAHHKLEGLGWDVVAWKASGGYGVQRKDAEEYTNKFRERVWFSPACLRQETLFDFERKGKR